MIREIRHALVGAGPLSPRRRFSQLALDGGRQSREIPFDDVVVGALLHRRDRDIFTDGARDEDKREVETAFTNDSERHRAAEVRHRVVRDGDIPRRRGQCVAQGVCGFYPRRVNVVT